VVQNNFIYYPAGRVMRQHRILTVGAVGLHRRQSNTTDSPGCLWGWIAYDL
jgi:hypothetical protein